MGCTRSEVSFLNLKFEVSRDGQFQAHPCRSQGNQQYEKNIKTTPEELREEVRIDKVDAFQDTGAAISVISPELAKILNLVIKHWERPTVVTADGQPLEPL